jgi:hypothetical protein
LLKFSEQATELALVTTANLNPKLCTANVFYKVCKIFDIKVLSNAREVEMIVYTNIFVVDTIPIKQLI